MMYAPNGHVVYSTDRKDLGGDFSAHRQFRTAAAGGIDTEYGFHTRFAARSGTQQDLWVLSTYLPVRAHYDRGPIIGVVEIYSDITAIRQSLITAALRTGAIVGAAFLVVFGMLLLMVWRADQTVREEHEAKLAMAAAMTQAEATAKEKTQFLASISHELRTPLNAIIGFAEILGNEIKGPLGHASYKEYITDIGKSGQHLLNIINEVLDLVKAESGTMAVDSQPTNMVSLAKGVTRMLAPEAESLGNTLAVETVGNVSAIETDPRKVRQVLINIVANGLKFTPEGGSVRIVLDQDDLTGQMRIRVVDTGIGMKPEDIPVAETPFGQVENVFTRTHKGTGLGLPLSRKFIEALGGSFLIESALGDGTTVTLTLPEKYQTADEVEAHWCDEAKAACGPAATPNSATTNGGAAAETKQVDAA
jgi:signal transduction histidine kinase